MKRAISSFLLPLFLASSFQLKGDYTPPLPQKLYDDAPFEVPKRMVSHAYLGLGIDVGQSRSTKTENPKVSFNPIFKFGYQKTLGSWNYAEFGADISSFGKLGHSEAELSNVFTGIGKFGYGYTITQGLRGLFHGGVGASYVNFKGKYDDANLDAVSGSGSFGFIVRAGYEMSLDISQSMSLAGGFAITHHEYSIGNIQIDGAGGNKVDAPKNLSVGLNVISLQLGMLWNI